MTFKSTDATLLNHSSITNQAILIFFKVYIAFNMMNEFMFFCALQLFLKVFRSNGRDPENCL